MKILFDTNMALDLLLDRQPFSTPAARLFALADEGVIEGCVCATTVTTVEYLASKAVGRQAALSLVRSMLEFLSVATVDESAIRRALDARPSDFEDAVVLEAARAACADGVVSRDKRGLSNPLIPVWLPGELLAMVDVLQDQIEVVTF